MKILKTLFSILFSVLLIANVNASEKWDMALAYGASNFHSANAAEFAKNVSENSGGYLVLELEKNRKGMKVWTTVKTVFPFFELQAL